MGKGKMSLLDVRCQVKELSQKLVGLRLANLYNLDAKTFVLKMSGPDQKELLLVESGVRLHTTKYAREHDKLPSNFCAKLRKHLRLKRLEQITQIGIDRIVDLQFGHGEQAYHLILEFYAQGNIILTDSSYRIIMLLRVHTYASAGAAGGMASIGAGAVLADGDAPAPASLSRLDSKDSSIDAAAVSAAAAEDAEDRVAVHEPYPHNQAQQSPACVTEAMVRACLEKQHAKETVELAAFNAKVEADERIAAAGGKQNDDAADSVAASGNQQGKKQRAKEDERIQSQRKARQAVTDQRKLEKPKMKAGMPLKAILSQDLHFGPDVIEHCLMLADIDPNQSLAQLLAADNAPPPQIVTSAQLARLCSVLQEAPALLDRISSEPMPGYIFWRVDSRADAVAKTPAPRKPKPAREKRNHKGELVVDEIDLPPTAAAAAAAATPVAAPAAAATVEHAATTAVAEAAPVAAASSFSAVVPAAAPSSSEGITLYTEYLPLLLSAQLQRPEYRAMPAPLKFDSFDAAMDEFYSKAEAQKEEVRLVKERAAALQKLEREKQRQASQLAALEAQQATSVLKANLIEQNLDAVNACIGSVNAEIAKGTDWRDLTRMIKEERQHGQNPIARMIHSLKLLENQITISLSEGLRHLLPECAGGKDRSVKVLQVELDLALTAFANAQLYYATKKQHAAKQVRAESASLLAIKAAERKTHTALSAVDIRSRIQRVRKTYWFEKFSWFLSSENYLVIGGKDAQQNEQLVKKYLGPNDVYVHAEVHGASSVIVKNPSMTAPVPPLTLAQAGTMTICRSSAWKNKVVVEAYWVKADQVSKIPPTGMHLPTGSFMIRGKKNFLPRCPLIMGIGLLFRVDDTCRAKHAGERHVRTAAEQETQAEDKYDQVSELPSIDSSSAPHKSASSKKKKQTGGSSSNKKKSAEIDAGDFDVTSNLRPAAASVAIGRLTSEDEATDTEEAEKRARLELVKAPPSAPLGKKKLSAAERKRMKKGGSASQADKQQNDDEEEAGESASVPVAVASAPVVESKAAVDSSDDEDWGNANKNKKKKKAAKKPAASGTLASLAAPALAPAAAPVKPLPRGKANKAKRAAARYANQDEDDLVLAASLLGLQNVDKKKKEVAAREQKFKPTRAEESESSSEEEEASAAVAEKATPAAASAPAAVDDAARVCFHCKGRGHVFKTCPRRLAEESTGGATAGPTFAQARKDAEDAESAELAQLREEEGVEEEDDGASAAQEAMELLALTGRPFADDLSHFILPVCAPYDALADYKYKLKLLPGMQKKGKAAKQALQLFLGSDKATSAERELLKLVPDQDLINVLLSNLKLSAPGQQGEGGKGKKTKKPARSASASIAGDE